jgi:hypothetical protein
VRSYWVHDDVSRYRDFDSVVHEAEISHRDMIGSPDRFLVYDDTRVSSDHGGVCLFPDRLESRVIFESGTPSAFPIPHDWRHRSMPADRYAGIAASATTGSAKQGELCRFNWYFDETGDRTMSRLASQWSRTRSLTLPFWAPGALAAVLPALRLFASFRRRCGSTPFLLLAGSNRIP